MAWGLWVMCPRSWGKLWLNLLLLTRVDGVQLAYKLVLRADRGFATVGFCGQHGPAIDYQIRSASEVSITYLHAAPIVRGREGSGLQRRAAIAPCARGHDPQSS